MKSRALVLLSGGMDSAVVTAILKVTMAVDGLFVDYGQPHLVREREAARAVARQLGVPLHETQCDLGELLPDSPVVVGRNLGLVHLGVRWAHRIGAVTVAIGCCRDDWEMFPDCRPLFVATLHDAIRAGYGIGLIAPVLGWGKQEIASKAEQFGLDLGITWSCYRGGESPCGMCGACLARSRASLVCIGPSRKEQDKR